MKPAPLPSNESERLEALRQTGTLDTAPEAVFDHLTDLAARLCGAPVALITLIDVDRQWFKSRHGIDVVETPRDIALCAYTILEDDMFVVDDVLHDERFADNPLVAKEPRIRFYAGSPLLTSDGHALGSFCVIDYEPRSLAPAHATALRALARHATALLQLRRVHKLLEVNSKEWERAKGEGDERARDWALEALGRNLTAMIAERERSEAALRAVEQQFEALAASRRVHSLEELLQALEGPLNALTETSEVLMRAMNASDPLRAEADSLHTLAQRVSSIVESAGGSSS